ncbi:TIGR00730 family Rossman fold protein [Desulfocurvibacter africanus]|uniref:LOG family protein n=1 Tax=Desulfocurvibacter africanus TaxID=873 RepID=UPI00041902BC|nr:TIGR00730 family Rossman fold protein [Desulfocurvibacter africanus]
MRRMCVFLGSALGMDKRHEQAAMDLGGELARRGLGLVYGGASVGLMGTVADACLAAGGEVVGVMPQALVDREVAHTGLTELHVVKSMHERKALMAELSDGFIALPGGLGTLEELFEVLTWAQLGYHRKPCGVLDVGSYFELLHAFLDHSVQQGFIRPQHRGILMSAATPVQLLDLFHDWQPTYAPKWIKTEREL